LAEWFGTPTYGFAFVDHHPAGQDRSRARAQRALDLVDGVRDRQHGGCAVDALGDTAIGGLERLHGNRGVARDDDLPATLRCPLLDPVQDVLETMGLKPAFDLVEDDDVASDRRTFLRCGAGQPPCAQTPVRQRNEAVMEYQRSRRSADHRIPPGS
jgi:hypothetical protein